MDSKGAVNAEYERLHQIARCVLDGSARPVHSADDLLKRAALLKDPVPRKVFEWTQYLTKLIEYSSSEHIEQVTREDVLAWRAEELSRSQSSAVKNRLTECLETILNKAQEPPKSKKVQHSNAKNAVLFEAINLIIHMDCDANLLVRACNQLGQFLQHRETNLR